MQDINEIKFPCPRNGKYTNFNECSECCDRDRCDVYLMMIDEDFSD